MVDFLNINIGYDDIARKVSSHGFAFLGHRRLVKHSYRFHNSAKQTSGNLCMRFNFQYDWIRLYVDAPVGPPNRNMFLRKGLAGR